jgi:hypothetical protein
MMFPYGYEFHTILKYPGAPGEYRYAGSRDLCVCVIREVVTVADSRLSYRLNVLKKAGLHVVCGDHGVGDAADTGAAGDDEEGEDLRAGRRRWTRVRIGVCGIISLYYINYLNFYSCLNWYGLSILLEYICIFSASQIISGYLLMDRQDILSVLIGVAIVLVVALVVKPALYGGPASGGDTAGALPTPAHVVTASDPTLHTGGKEILREFRWTAIDGGVQTATLKIPSSLFDRERDAPRIPDHAAWGRYALSDEERPYLEDLARQIAPSRFNTPDEDYYRVMNVLFFVQQLPYSSDDAPASYIEGAVPVPAMHTSKGVEYPKYPVETLVDGKGDCEDSSILAAALLNLMDYDVVLLGYSDHMAVGVQMTNFDPYYADYAPKYYNSMGKRYYYAETTNYTHIQMVMTSGENRTISADRWGKPFPVGDTADGSIKSVKSETPTVIPLHYIVRPAHHTVVPARPIPGGEGGW